MKKAILVLGPPRSGTSVVSHIIHKLGVDFGGHDRFVNPQVHRLNPIFFELQSLNDLNDEIFHYFSKEFSDFDWMPEEIDFTAEIINKFEKRIALFVSEEFSGSTTIGLKDPRFCFTLPLWSAVLKRLGFDVLGVLTNRLSGSVYISNIIENKYSPATNFRLVAQSTILANQFLQKEKHLTVSYRALLSDPRTTIFHICNRLDLDCARVDEARSVIREDLNHQKENAGLFLYSYFQNVIDATALSPVEHLQYREIYSAATFDKDSQIVGLNETLAERNSQIVGLNETLAERDSQIVGLNETLAERDSQIAGLNQGVESYVSSLSWRLTKPGRLIINIFKSLIAILNTLYFIFTNFKTIKRLANELLGKMAHVERQLQLLQSDAYATQVAKERGLSPELLKILIVFGHACIAIKNTWQANSLRKQYTERLFAFFLGQTKETQKISSSHLHIHVDKPSKLLNLVDNSFVISGWAVDIETVAAARIRVRIGKTVYRHHLKHREDVQRAFLPICELPVEVGFAVLPSLSIGLHRMWVDIEVSNSIWIPVRRAWLFRLPRIKLTKRAPRLSYKAWIRLEKKQLHAELDDIKRHISVMLHRPKFSVIVDTRQSIAGLASSLQSIREQIYPYYDFYFLANPNTSLAIPLVYDTKILQELSITNTFGEFIIFLDSGQCLAINSLYEFANAINQYPSLDLIYGDQDRLTSSGERYAPFYKPNWSPDYLETFNYIGFPTCFRTTLTLGHLDSHLYDLTLRITELTDNILHIPKILGHQVDTQCTDMEMNLAAALNIAALQERVNRTGRNGFVREHDSHRGCFEIELILKRQPFVSVIIPTAGKTVLIGERQIDLITNVVDQIKNASTYKNIEIIVVDNGDLSEKQQQCLTGHGCRLVTYTESIFNISKKLNLGASIANGEFLLLMNDDIEIVNSSWIERMIEHFEKPHVGVVGGKLLYPDGRTQHVGVVHNYGNPDHVRRLFPGDEAGYYFSTCGVRNFMAVTGAAMMTRTTIYHEVGGYSEELAVSYNDADYCLKVGDKGYSIVYAPKANLIHMESLSRVASADMAEVTWYHKRWASNIIADPYYNEQFLTVASPTFLPCINPRLL